MSIEQQQDLAHYRRAAQALVRDALDHNVVITITIKPRLPLAMGNYDLVAKTELEVDVRERHVLAEPINRTEGAKS